MSGLSFRDAVHSLENARLSLTKRRSSKRLFRAWSRFFFEAGFDTGPIGWWIAVEIESMERLSSGSQQLPKIPHYSVSITARNCRTPLSINSGEPQCSILTLPV